jgi:hypothetical protein
LEAVLRIFISLLLVCGACYAGDYFTIDIYDLPKERYEIKITDSTCTTTHIINNVKNAKDIQDIAKALAKQHFKLKKAGK